MIAEVQVDVQIASDAKSVPTVGEIRHWIVATITAVDSSLYCEVSVRIVDVVEGRALNREYRNKDYATNVLSFSVGEEGALMAPDLPRMLGDIVICGPVVEQEAAKQSKDVADHWGHMLVHGALHLLGHDHDDDEDAARMESIEMAILAGKGVPDPYVR